MLVVSTDIRFKLNSKLVLKLDAQFLKTIVQFLLVFLLQWVVIEGGGRGHWQVLRLWWVVILLKRGGCLWKLVSWVLNPCWFWLFTIWIQLWLCSALRLFKWLSNNFVILIWWRDPSSRMASLIFFRLFNSPFHDSLHLIPGFSARLFNLPIKFTLHSFLLLSELFLEDIDLFLQYLYLILTIGRHLTLLQILWGKHRVKMRVDNHGCCLALRGSVLVHVLN